MEALGRVELPTNGLGNRCSIHLSYRAARRDGLTEVSLSQPCRALVAWLDVRAGPRGDSRGDPGRSCLSARMFLLPLNDLLGQRGFLQRSATQAGSLNFVLTASPHNAMSKPKRRQRIGHRAPILRATASRIIMPPGKPEL